MQGSAEGLDRYDIVASAGIVGKDSCLIEDFAEANIFNVKFSRLTDLQRFSDECHCRVSRFLGSYAILVKRGAIAKSA